VRASHARAGHGLSSGRNDLPGETVRERLGEAMDQLDDVIHEIRDYALTAGETGDGPGPDRPGAS
jgi:hypothetical protein